MEKISLEIIAISHSITQSHNYAVILGELGGNRRLPIVIGGFEAQAIAVAIEKMTPNRPLTHDLFKMTLDQFGIALKEVIINDLVDGIFYAQLVCDNHGEIHVIDSRTSDALALAVRFKCPIYTFDFVMDSAAITVDQEIEDIDAPGSPAIRDPKDKLKSLSSGELERMLNEVLEQEDYEQAAKIRDEIKRRSEQQ
jgi:uncharacterized protein